MALRDVSRLMMLLVLLLAGSAWGVPKVIRSYDWNGHRYCIVQRDDGSRVEVKGLPAMKDAEAVVKCPAVEAMAAEVTAKILVDYSDAEIVAEAKRRRLVVTAAELEIVK